MTLKDLTDEIKDKLKKDKYHNNEFFINGGVAHLFKKGDKIVIASFAKINDVEYHGSRLTKKHKSTMVIV